MILAAESAQVASPPWWGVPVIAGTFLVIGALLNWGLTTWTERRRHRREDRNLWKADLREAAESLIALAQQTDLMAHHFSTSQKFEATPQSKQSENELFVDLGKAITLVIERAYMVAILAPTDLGKKAQRIAGKTAESAMASLKHEDSFPQISSGLKDEVADFMVDLRKHLEIPDR